jgi:hypothetical protein
MFGSLLGVVQRMLAMYREWVRQAEDRQRAGNHQDISPSDIDLVWWKSGMLGTVWS